MFNTVVKRKLTHREWKKNLYENYGYPDNYTDKTFLQELKKNTCIKEVTFFEAALGATRLVQELCCVVTFVIIFVYLHNKWVEPNTIFYSCNVLTTLGFLNYRLFYGVKTTISQDTKTVLIFIVFGQIFSPVLHTLTDTVSTDTIYTATTFMMIVHLIFFDYGVPAAVVSSSLSLSAAMFGSICLSSRLASPYHAFVLLTVAVECFALFPMLRSKMQSLLLTILMVITTIYFLFTVSTTVTVMFIITLVFINIVCPMYFLRWQRFKENIYGPWDEAIIEDTDDINKF